MHMNMHTAPALAHRMCIYEYAQAHVHVHGRWEHLLDSDRPNAKGLSLAFAEHGSSWVRPQAEEKPQKARVMEGGAYW